MKKNDIKNSLQEIKPTPYFETRLEAKVKSFEPAPKRSRKLAVSTFAMCALVLTLGLFAGTKLIKTKQIVTFLDVLHLSKNLVAILSNAFKSLKHSTIIIKLNNSISTLKSIYSILGTEKNDVMIARTIAITHTHSFFNICLNLSIYKELLSSRYFTALYAAILPSPAALIN